MCAFFRGGCLVVSPLEHSESGGIHPLGEIMIMHVEGLVNVDGRYGIFRHPSFAALDQSQLSSRAVGFRVLLSIVRTAVSIAARQCVSVTWQRTWDV